TGVAPGGCGACPAPPARAARSAGTQRRATPRSVPRGPRARSRLRSRATRRPRATSRPRHARRRHALRTARPGRARRRRARRARTRRGARRARRDSALGPWPRDPGLDQRVAQTLETRADTALHRALGLLEQRSDLAVAVAAEVGQLDGTALAVVQLAERGPHVLGDREIQDLPFEVVAGLAGEAGPPPPPS